MRVALAQINPTVGDVQGNLALILEAARAARRDGAEVLVTSELALIGYPPRDLLLREGVVESCERAVQAIAREAGDLCVLVGHPRRVWDGVGDVSRPLRNSVSACRAGRVIATYDKRLLPGYDVFDEDRYFEPGREPLVLDVNGTRCGIVICEDLWRATDVTAERRYPVEPVAEVVARGCDLLISLNASPFVLGKWQKHVMHLREVAREHHMPIIAVNQVGANDDQVFDGRGVIVAPDGEVARVFAGFEPETRTIDLAEVARGAVPATKQIERWSSQPRELFAALTLGIRDYCRKTGNRDVLLGLSGGIDSALVAALAAAAIGPNHVHGVMMPSQFSSRGSIDDAIELARRLGLPKPRQMPVKELHEMMRGSLTIEVGDKVAGVTDENVQARLRGVMLMAMSNALGGLVLATSNKSEMAVGYSTLYGDMCGALAPLGDMTKTRIYELARWINANFAECGFAEPPIPPPSIDKPPSAELRPNQTDQDSLPPYDVLDEIIERRIELEQSEPTIIAETGFDAAIVRRSLGLIDRAQFKRDQAPVVLKVSGRAFGPGRPMPIVMKENLRIDAGGVGENLSVAVARLPAARANTDNGLKLARPPKASSRARDQSTAGGNS